MLQEKKLREEQRDKYKQVLAQKEQEILLLENVCPNGVQFPYTMNYEWILVSRWH